MREPQVNKMINADWTITTMDWETVSSPSDTWLMSQPVVNKMINEDGSLTTINGEAFTSTSKLFDSFQPLANKFLRADGVQVNKDWEVLDLLNADAEFLKYSPSILKFIDDDWVVVNEWEEEVEEESTISKSFQPKTIYLLNPDNTRRSILSVLFNFISNIINNKWL